MNPQQDVGQWAAIVTVVIAAIAYIIKITIAFGKLESRLSVNEEKVNSLDAQFSANDQLLQKTYDVAVETNITVKVTEQKVNDLESRLDRDHDRRQGKNQ